MFGNHTRTAVGPNINLQAIVTIVAMVMMAVLVGLIATTANLSFVVLLVGLMVGIPLLSAPRITILIILALGMISGFIYSTFASTVGGKLTWGVAMLGILIILPCILKLLGGLKDTPSFIWLALVFMIYTLIAAVLQGSPMNEYVAGLKRYFQMYGLMFALALLDFKAEDHRRWLNFMLLIALLQLPFCLYERIVVIPKLGRSGPLVDSIDVVSGTLGGGLEGGSTSGDMASFLIMAIAFVMARYRAGLVRTQVTIILLILLMIPLVLGETKSVVILLPLVWFVLLRKEFTKKPAQFFLQFLAIFMVSLAIGMVYVSMSNRGGIHSSVEKTIDNLLSYNIGTKSYTGKENSLNRTTVLSHWWNNQSWQDPLGLLVGNGLGSSASVGGTLPGHMGEKYFGWGIDLTSASVLLWETGLLGFLLFISILSSAWLSAGRLWTRVTDPTVRADALAIQAAIAILMFQIFYNSSLVNLLPFELITAYLLGYLGYLVRVHLPQQRIMIGAMTPNNKM
jgi:hypothetical protein